MPSFKIDFIPRGKPRQNAYVERLNRTVSYEWLEQYEFKTFADMQDFATKLIWPCYHDCPHMALGGITLKQHLAVAV